MCSMLLQLQMVMMRISLIASVRYTIIIQHRLILLLFGADCFFVDWFGDSGLCICFRVRFGVLSFRA